MPARTLQAGMLENNTGCVPPHYLLKEPLDLTRHPYSLITAELDMTRLSQDNNLDMLRADVAAVLGRRQDDAMKVALDTDKLTQDKKRRISKGAASAQVAVL